MNTLPATTTVKLRCVKIQGKLRVRITSVGYNNDANCQFPRAIRQEGREYTAPSSSITFSEGANLKFFYRVKKSQITIVDEIDTIDTIDTIEKVFGDDDVDNDCIVCMDNQKDVVFAMCGHYCCCNACATSIKNGKQSKCPMCRQDIVQIVKRDQIQ